MSDQELTVRTLGLLGGEHARSVLGKDGLERSGLVKVGIGQVSLVDVGRVTCEDTTLGVHGGQVAAALNGTLLDTASLVLGSTVAQVGSLGVGGELLALPELLLDISSRVGSHQGGRDRGDDSSRETHFERVNG